MPFILRYRSCVWNNHTLPALSCINDKQTAAKMTSKGQHALVNEYIQSMKLHDGRIVNSAGGGAQVWSKQNGSWKIVSVSASNKP
ncbi:hypothetical protein [Flocculibacter collagenilyticus]|uniref:hypothetical protein n=1 Tax=Flocculibacter collagenilyticus TaxID=2744479 RepID=UPI0018F43B7B|nr:hypothetical protein [Flocculibacter collagenilyticus]